MTTYQSAAAQQWQAQPEPRNGFGITALVLGILAVLFGLIPLTGFIAFGLGAVGLIFGLSNVGRIRRRRATNKGMTWTGGILSALGVVLGIIGMVTVFAAVDQLGDDLEEISRDLDAYNACIEDADTVEEMAACE